jgi:hypothetical protein
MMIKKIFIIIFLYFFIFLTKSFACSIDKLKIGSDINTIKIDKIFLSLFKLETELDGKKYNKYTIPVEAICIRDYGGFLLEIDTQNNKIFRVLFINSVTKEKVLLKLSKKIYSLDFTFENKSDENLNLNSEIKKDSKYFYYSYFKENPLESRNSLEIFEIVDPDYSQYLRTVDEMSEEIE